MAQPILAIDHINGPQVYRLNLADPTSPGAAIGGLIPAPPTFTGAWTTQNYQSNFVIRHGYKIYAFHRVKIYVYDELDPTSDWVEFYAFPENFTPGNQVCGGLHKMIIDDDPHLVVIGAAASTANIQHLSWNLRTNTLRAEGVIPGGFIDNQSFKDVQPWKQFLFYFDSTPSDIHKFDSVNNVTQTVSFNGSGLDDTNDSCLFVPWNNKLYMLHVTTAGTASWRLYEYDEGLDSFLVVLTLPSSQEGAGQNSAQTRATAWQQGGFLYAILDTVNGGFGSGWTMWRFSQGTNLTVDDITASLPANLRMFPTGNNDEPAAWNDQQRWTAIIDQEANPASPVTTIYLHETGAPTTGTLAVYSWVDPVLTLIDSGIASNFVIPKELDGGGSRFWTPGDVVPEVVLIQSTGTTVRMTFKLHGGGVQSLGIWWALEHDVPTTRGTLVNPSSGTITGGGNDVLSGITADGVTQYSVEWRAQFDGVSDLDDVNFMIKPD